MRLPDHGELRDLGLLVVLSANLEREMVMLYCMILNEDIEQYEHYLSGPSRVAAAGNRAVEHLRRLHADLAEGLAAWNMACESARQERHRMVHSIPVPSGLDRKSTRWWHPKSGDVEKFDGVVALILQKRLMDCFIEGRALGDRIHDRTCTSEHHYPPIVEAE